MVKESCENCRFYSDFNCRRHAPVIVVNAGFSISGGTASWSQTKYPDTFPQEWCGDWEMIPSHNQGDGDGKSHS